MSATDDDPAQSGRGIQLAAILAALAEQQRLRSRIAVRHNTDAAARLAALLDEHAHAGTPLPGLAGQRG